MNQGDIAQILDIDSPYFGQNGIIQGKEGDRVLIRLSSGEYVTARQYQLYTSQVGDYQREIQDGDAVRILHPEWEGEEGVVVETYEDWFDDRVVVLLTDGYSKANLAVDDVELVAEDTRISGDGNNSSYYIVRVEHPTDESWEPYDAQCNDLIEALGMTFSEGEAFKAIWRRCRARQGFGKKGNSQRYDAEKVKFFGHRMVVQSND